jgi:hypothetical protein
MDVLDYGALEPSLPDVPGGAMPFMIMPGVSYGERLEDSADRLPGVGLEQQVEVIGHETIAKESEGKAFLGLGECVEECETVVIIAEDNGAVVAAIEGMIDEAVIGDAR